MNHQITTESSQQLHTLSVENNGRGNAAGTVTRWSLPDRRIERLARRSRVPLLWDLEDCIGKLADAATGARLRQPLAEISAFMEGIDTVGAVPSRKPPMTAVVRFQRTTGNRSESLKSDPAVLILS